MRKLKKTAMIGMVFMLVMAMCLSSYAFADNRPSGGGMGGGPNGQQGGYGMEQSGNQNPGGMSQGGSQMGNNNPMGNERPDNTDGESSGSTNNMPNGKENGMSGSSSGMPNGNAGGMADGKNQMRPDANGMDLMAVEAYLETDDADDSIKSAYDALKKALAGTPGEDGSEDIETLENTLKNAIETAGIELSDYSNDQGRKEMGINLMAVEAYLETDDADENVRTAYDALEAALSEEPDDETDDNIAELESSLETALESAGVDIDEYMNVQPEGNPMGDQPENNPNNEPYMGINMKAVETYLETDDADENVRTAYDALEAALTEQPEDGTDSDISGLETALETALESAGVDISEYESTENMPQEQPQRANTVQPGSSAENSELTEQENNIIQAIWNRILSLFR